MDINQIQNQIQIQIQNQINNVLNNQIELDLGQEQGQVLMDGQLNNNDNSDIMVLDHNTMQDIKDADVLINNYLDDSIMNQTEDEMIEDINEIFKNVHLQQQYSLSQKGVKKVNTIITSKMTNGKEYFLVKWDKEDTEPTWEPIENISKYTLQLYNYKRDAIEYNKLIVGSNTSAYIYLRTSRARISDSQVSIDVQKRDMLKHCKDNNVMIKGIFADEGTSARNMDNLEGLNLILKEIQPYDYLLVWDVSRFSRNCSQAVQLLDNLALRHIKVYFFTENLMYDGAMAKHHIRLSLSAAQLYSDTVSEKVKAAFQFKRENGDYVGGKPKFGYQVKHIKGRRRVVENPREQKLIKLVKSIVKSYMETNDIEKLQRSDMRAIAYKLNSRNIKFRGRPFNCNNVSLMMTR
jgi:DNA invertase Pin-like site-specific DNA recombinase